MEVKKITEGMTAPQVAEVIDSNFRGIMEETDEKLYELGRKQRVNCKPYDNFSVVKSSSGWSNYEIDVRFSVYELDTARLIFDLYNSTLGKVDISVTITRNDLLDVDCNGSRNTSVKIKRHRIYTIKIKSVNGVGVVYVDGVKLLDYSDSVSDNRRIWIGKRIEAIPTILGVYDTFKYRLSDGTHFSLTDKQNDTYEIVDTSYIDSVKMMRGLSFTEKSATDIVWADGTSGNIIDVQFDENSLGVKSFVITYGEYTITQPNITYNENYEVETVPELLISK
jgi:hypothetical protein